MKLLLVLLLIGCTCQAQNGPTPQMKTVPKWKLDKNKLLTGGLVFLAGGCKGFNETLEFHYKVFKEVFPNADRHWFDPKSSWRNKYKNRDPQQGPKFPLSTTVFAFTTDQYHLNNFIGRSAIFTALAIKIGERKRPFRQYLFDLLYYTACYQAGFAINYYPYASWKRNRPTSSPLPPDTP